MNATFSDVRHRLVETVAEGDLVAAYTRMSAVQSGDTFGFPGTGEAFDVEQMHIIASPTVAASSSTGASATTPG